MLWVIYLYLPYILEVQLLKNSISQVLKSLNNIYLIAIVAGFLILGFVIAGWPAKNKLSLMKPVVIVFIGYASNKMLQGLY
jgi:energy-coupling factor transporter transmembrane protein EcfT